MKGEEDLAMDKIIDKVLIHPIATAFIAATVLGGIADIIKVAKGQEVNPGIKIEFKSRKEEES